MKLHELEHISINTSNNGEIIHGTVKVKDIEKCLRSTSDWKVIQVAQHGFETNFSWNIIKKSLNVQHYIEEVLPEYLI